MKDITVFKKVFIFLYSIVLFYQGDISGYGRGTGDGIYRLRPQEGGGGYLRFYYDI